MSPLPRFPAAVCQQVYQKPGRLSRLSVGENPITGISPYPVDTNALFCYYAPWHNTTLHREHYHGPRPTQLHREHNAPQGALPRAQAHPAPSGAQRSTGSTTTGPGHQCWPRLLYVKPPPSTPAPARDIGILRAISWDPPAIFRDPPTDSGILRAISWDPTTNFRFFDSVFEFPDRVFDSGILQDFHGSCQQSKKGPDPIGPFIDPPMVLGILLFDCGILRAISSPPNMPDTP